MIGYSFMHSQVKSMIALGKHQCVIYEPESLFNFQALWLAFIQGYDLIRGMGSIVEGALIRALI